VGRTEGLFGRMLGGESVMVQSGCLPLKNKTWRKKERQTDVGGRGGEGNKRKVD